MKKRYLLVTIIMTILCSHSYATTVTEESYPSYYKEIDRIVVKDVMTRYFNVNQSGIMSYGLEDAAKTAGHICPAITGAFLMTQHALSALATDYRNNPSNANITSYDSDSGLMYRGGIHVTMSGKDDVGNAPNAMANIMSLITGAKGADGFKKGPDFPFANRQNLLHYDSSLAFNPKTGIEAIFTSMVASYQKKDTNGLLQPADYETCQGTWGVCVETTRCDRSVKVTYHFKSPDIIGSDKTETWDKKIKHIIDHVDKAIKVESVENPIAICSP